MNTLEQRKKIYGDFQEISEISQKIKDMYYANITDEIDATINEAFEMIAHKLARIINGGSRYIDNWRDIAGYAQLAVDYLDNKANNATDSVIVYKEKKNGIWSFISNDVFKGDER